MPLTRDLEDRDSHKRRNAGGTPGRLSRERSKELRRPWLAREAGCGGAESPTARGAEWGGWRDLSLWPRSSASRALFSCSFLSKEHSADPAACVLPMSPGLSGLAPQRRRRSSGHPASQLCQPWLGVGPFTPEVGQQG